MEALLLTRIKDDMKSSMKSGDKARLGVIRLILSAVKQIEVDERITLDDVRVLQVLDKMLKQRRESIRQFLDAGRMDLVTIEEFEVGVIQEFMPVPLTEEEIDKIIHQVIEEVGATSIKEMGKVMALVKDKLQGRADMAEASARIKGFLTA
ncbi:MAG: GatB/YqeY domain-containing protein [Methylococcaceae bacterium]|nr:MAG: GatB/YqeY domain-containing protein [Methylococcaceae bacterium]